MVIHYIKDFLSEFFPAWLSDDEWYKADMTPCKIKFNKSKSVFIAKINHLDNSFQNMYDMR